MNDRKNACRHCFFALITAKPAAATWLRALACVIADTVPNRYDVSEANEKRLCLVATNRPPSSFSLSHESGYKGREGAMARKRPVADGRCARNLVPAGVSRP